MMRLLPVVLIVFVCSLRLPDALGCFGFGGTQETTTQRTTTKSTTTSWRNEEVYCKNDEIKDLLKDNGEEWDIFCCTWSSRNSVVQRKCSGLDCTTVCDDVAGPRSDCVPAIFGSDPLAEAKDHCDRVRKDMGYCHLGNECSKMLIVTYGTRPPSGFHYATKQEVTENKNRITYNMKKWDSLNFAGGHISYDFSGSRWEIVDGESYGANKILCNTFSYSFFPGGYNRKKREVESNHTITKRNNDFACGTTFAIHARPCFRRVKNKYQMKKMACPCCLVPEMKNKICGKNKKCPSEC